MIDRTDLALIEIAIPDMDPAYGALVERLADRCSELEREAAVAAVAEERIGELEREVDVAEERIEELEREVAVAEERVRAALLGKAEV